MFAENAYAGICEHLGMGCHWTPHRDTREFGIPVSVKAGNAEAVSNKTTVSNFLGSENKNISGVILIKTFEPHKLLKTLE